jgi:hypothetical protein
MGSAIVYTNVISWLIILSVVQVRNVTLKHTNKFKSFKSLICKQASLANSGLKIYIVNLNVIQYDLFNRIPKFLHIFQEVEEEELTADEVLQRLQVR